MWSCTSRGLRHRALSCLARPALVPTAHVSGTRCPSAPLSRCRSSQAEFTGVWTIMATPFHPDARETLDLASFTRAIHFMREAGVTGVTIAGVLGESNRLVDSELETLVRAAVDAAGNMPICVGVSHAGTAATASRAEMVAECGGAAIMVTPLKEPKPTPGDKIVAHFEAIAAAAPALDIVLQDHPASTQVHMSLPLIADIAAAVPSVRCIKLESTPTAARTKELIALMNNHTGIETNPTILTGLGGLYGAFELAAGADGFMTGFAFPEVLVAMVHASKRGDKFAAATCMNVFKEYLPLIVFEQQPGIATRKHIYKLRGIFDSGHVRHPGAQLSAADAQMIEQLVAETFPEGLSPDAVRRTIDL
eukprot:m.206906 g.206906  ORF g.206906 m.206906 type:complete len:364 (-) comp23516_c0_seq1:160-1251(-)